MIGDETTEDFVRTTKTIGHFELIESIGSGGFGTVWKARDTKLGRTVAIKLPRHHQLSDADTDLFFREARAAASLNHPNIVAIHEVGRQGDQPFIVSDLIDGVNLREWLSAKQLDWMDTARLCGKISEAVQHAHGKGVIHRDLKPGNVMMDLHGEPHVMDFGLAKRDVEDVTMTMDGKVLGTPAYMSPEQAAGKSHEADARSDVYSLGVMLFELLTGEIPFRGEKRMMLMQIVHDSPPNPRKLNANIPRDLDTICLKCLSKEPSRRYQSASALAADLIRAVENRPIEARRVSRIEKTWLWCRRRPAIAGLTAAILLLSVIAAIVVWQSQSNRIRAVAEAEYNDERRRLAESARQRIEAEQMETETQRAKAVAAQEAEAEARLQIEHLNRRIESLLYGKQLSLAQAEWELGNEDRARGLLQDVRWDLRGWEYGLLQTRCLDANAQDVIETDSGFFSLDVSPDGRRLVSGSLGGGVKIWDTRTRREVLSLDHHTRHVSCVAFSPDGKLIASGSWDKTVRLWDVESGAELGVFEHSGRVFCLAFSPDGSTLVSGGVYQDQDDMMESIGGGLSISRAGKGEVKVIDVGTGEVKVSTATTSGNVYGIAFSPNGDRFVTGASNALVVQGPGQVTIWDANTGHEISELLGHADRVRCVTFSPDGKRVVSGSDEAVIRVHDVESGMEVSTLTGHFASIVGLQFTPDGTRIVSSSDDLSIKVWDAEGGYELLTLEGHTSYVCALSLSADASFLVSGDLAGAIRLWDASRSSGQRSLNEHRETVYGVCVSADGAWIASGAGDDNSGEVKIWNSVTGKESRTIRGHKDLISDVAISSDALRLVSGCWDGNVQVWDTVDGSLLHSFRGSSLSPNAYGSIESVCFSPNDQNVAACTDSVVSIWSMETGKEVHTLHLDPGTYPRSVCFSPDGTQVASGPAIWSVRTGEIQVLLQTSGQVFAFSSDGAQIVGIAGNEVMIWDAETGQVLHTFQGHTQEIHSVAFSPDDTQVVSGSFDSTIRLWDVASEQELIAFSGSNAGVECVAFSPDGKTILSGGYDSMIRVWDVPPAFRINSADRSPFNLEKYSWHRLQLANALQSENSFAAAYHREQLDLLLLTGEEIRIH